MRVALVASLFALAASFCLAQSASTSADNACTLTRGEVLLVCPQGWTILDESSTTAIFGNYQRPADAPKNTYGGRGKAFVEFSTIPAAYRDLAAWIFAGRRVAPDSVETRLRVNNRLLGAIDVVCLSSPESSRAAYASYFFQIHRKAVLLTLNWVKGDPRADAYRAAVLGVIETARTRK